MGYIVHAICTIYAIFLMFINSLNPGDEYIYISVNNGSLPIQRQAFIPTLTYRQLDPYEQPHLTKSKDTNIFF